MLSSLNDGLTSVPKKQAAAIKSKEQQVQQRIAASSISCTSMVVTVFGDVVSQHGGWIWLGSLINAMKPFGFSERLVRTAVYRLVQSEWLMTKKVGRCSYYCFTETAKNHYEKAARRIYHSSQQEWNGCWTLVIPVSVSEEQRDEFRKSLGWQGFNVLSNGILAHPSPDRRSLDETLLELGLVNSVIVMSASTDDAHSTQAIRELSRERWNIDELQRSYSEFLEFYRPWHQDASSKLPSGKDCFLMRSMLIHDFRRILLRDPNFPDAMLPHGWIGYEAHDLLHRLYRRLTDRSVSYITSNLESVNGHLPDPRADFYHRFGGLK
ncbi:phenylacetic acid degradation operon negative regulatory protein PaaX [Endozoicomonas sp. OPT23]|uniref:phenylacetic acid degradation operon negative regulatory protein PaaX n=1 Tax=Endozoicomonas sp. OPT23 TaxID=2072845 RepID=UPI00129A0B7E|nr:phenylacetic acid degradation operon negative regulatory protein PaaX [Endozoicomonas sp. OPT23]MRI33614.1 phenylacetic acid degradation operon negative regulatory protein PaaX [Endozoicomonas sp. OPT23]